MSSTPNGVVATFVDALGNDFALWASLAAALGFTLLAVYPIQMFLRHGWPIKRREIEDSLSDTAKELYLREFLNETIDKTAGQTAKTVFADMYDTRYGRVNFILPLIFFIVATYAATFLLAQSAIGWMSFQTAAGLRPIASSGLGTPLIVIPAVAAAGISGAYLWIVADMIDRARRLALTAADVGKATLRMAMSAAVSTALVAIAAPAVALPIAFAAGAFPLETVSAMFRRFASEKLGLGIGIQQDSPSQVLNLDGVDRPTADRLFDADISTIAKLAYADPVQLAMQTGLRFDYVIDIASQALAWVYLGDRLNDLRPAGLRGAIEICYFLKQLTDPAAKVYPLMLQLLAVAPRLPQDVVGPPPVKRQLDMPSFLNACDEIANDPYTEFLMKIWSDGSPDFIVPDYPAILAAVKTA
jgi:hypothetical protein